MRRKASGRKQKLKGEKKDNGEEDAVDEVMLDTTMSMLVPVEGFQKTITRSTPKRCAWLRVMLVALFILGNENHHLGNVSPYYLVCCHMFLRVNGAYSVKIANSRISVYLFSHPRRTFVILTSDGKLRCRRTALVA